MKYVHTNLVAEDWKKLADFYQNVFECKVIQPERDLSGEWLERATRIPNAKIKGVHLRLPGYKDDGPTLEIFEYTKKTERPKVVPNRLGITHIAFAVEDVEAVKNAVVAAGGKIIGEIVSINVPSIGLIEFAYVTDIEGNIIEIQKIRQFP